MLSSLRRCAMTLTRMNTSKVKVTQDQRSQYLENIQVTNQTTGISYFPILDQWQCTILVSFKVLVRLREKQNVLKKIVVLLTALLKLTVSETLAPSQSVNSDIGLFTLCSMTSHFVYQVKDVKCGNLFKANVFNQAF